MIAAQNLSGVRMRIAKVVKWLLIGAGSLTAIGIVVAIGFVWFGPVAISDKTVLFNMLVGRSIGAPALDTINNRLQLPPGFKVNLFAGDVAGARFMRVTSQGDVLVSLPRTGQVIWLEHDGNNDGRSDSQHVLIDNLNRPHGLEIYDGWLYVGENDAIGRVRLDKTQSKLDGTYERIVTGLTGDGNHWSKTVRIGPDGYLYLSQGSTCNVCVEQDPRRASIMRFKPDGSDGQIIANGLRNSVGFDWAPWDNALYATENSRDLLGDDVPNDELNLIQAGGFYGWPYVHGFGVVDSEFGKDQATRIATSITPAHGFRPHNAPLGIHFLRKPAPGYERSALVALHGSWNRSMSDGYKVVSLHWSADGKIEERDFLTGFLTDKGIIGRPVDVAEDNYGTIFVSDDLAGVIYRVTYADK
jgi:glucose/arabinose dehydrogenase